MKSALGMVGRKAMRGLLLVALGVAVLIGSPQPAWADTPLVGIGASVEDVDDAAGFRRVAGLAADDATVAESFDRPTVYSDRRFGIPLTEDEAGIIADQIKAQNALIPAAEAATKLAGFSGVYFERGTLHVLVTGDLETARVALEATRPASGQLVIEHATVDHRTLEGIRTAILSDQDLAALGATFSTVAIDPVTSRVELTVKGSDPVDEVAELLATKYGDAVVVLTTEASISALACNSQEDCGLKGGLSGRHTSPGVTCTTGFIARMGTTSLNRIITAGHCIEDAGGPPNNYAWKNYSGTMFWGYNSTYQYDALNDIGFITVECAVACNKYFASGPSDIRTVRLTWATDAGMPVGRYVCRSGHTSNWDCGYINRTDVSAVYDGLIHYGLWEVTPKSTYGDSGAGYVALEADQSYVIPYGILSAGQTGVGALYTYYYPANNAGYYNTYPCTVSGC